MNKHDSFSQNQSNISDISTAQLRFEVFPVNNIKFMSHLFSFCETPLWRGWRYKTFCVLQQLLGVNWPHDSACHIQWNINAKKCFHDTYMLCFYIITSEKAPRKKHKNLLLIFEMFSKFTRFHFQFFIAVFRFSSRIGNTASPVGRTCAPIRGSTAQPLPHLHHPIVLFHLWCHPAAVHFQIPSISISISVSRLSSQSSRKESFARCAASVRGFWTDDSYLSAPLPPSNPSRPVLPLQANLVAAFEQSLALMTARLQTLSVSSDHKVSPSCLWQPVAFDAKAMSDC